MAGRLGGMKGGGFLNNVDGLVVGYTLTNAFPGQAADPDDAKVYMLLKVQQDGATDVKETTLGLGSGQFLEISKDGQSLTNIDGQQARIWDKSDGYHFLASVETAGVPDGGIDDTEPSVLSFGGLVGRRFRFVQEKDEDRMEARRKAGKNPNRVVERDGESKEYPFTRLVVTDAYPGVSAVPKSQAPAAGKPGRKPTTTKATAPTPATGSGKGSSVATTHIDLDTEAADVLKRILSENEGSIQRSQIAMLVTTGETSNPRREQLRKRIFSEDFLNTEAGWSFDQSSKTQGITLNS